MILKDINIKKLVLQILFLLTCFLLVMSLQCCTRYYDPYVYANPKHKFETGNKRYERKLRRLERRDTKTIDPLRMHNK
jgi:hypothetical protein